MDGGSAFAAAALGHRPISEPNDLPTHPQGDIIQRDKALDWAC
jgi:hypothetical protein